MAVIPDNKSLDKLIDSLEERVKELNCIYEVEELLHRTDITLDQMLNELVHIIPSGFQYADICVAEIVYQQTSLVTNGFKKSQWILQSKISVQNQVVGELNVYYLEAKPESHLGPFLYEEKALLDSISKRVGHFILYEKLKLVFNKWESTKQDMSEKKSGEWQIVLELLQRTDHELFLSIARKMLNHLVWKGVSEAEELLQRFNPDLIANPDKFVGETNIPTKIQRPEDSGAIIKDIFDVAARHLSPNELLTQIQIWVQQSRTHFLIRAVANQNTSLSEISDALRRYFQLNPEGMQLSPSTRLGARASLIRRFFSDQLEFINIAKNYVLVTDFHKMLKTLIFPVGSHGKLGGKSAGIFLAYRILKSDEEHADLLESIKTPKTWYITSDAMINFMHYNNLEEVLEQKYKSLDEVRKEYPHVVQLFKNSHFPQDLLQGLSMALDDFGTNPIVVRSSSILEDRLGSAFAGKYKSLFIANQGSKQERLNALTDAIAEVYASTIGPDPIEYRKERGLLDFHEEMGIMIQEVVGKKIGDYFLPSFAGVAFSNNEFRWSPRINREDGLVRLVPGLGTRAVDRLSDDYPFLLAPGQPGLRANVSVEERIRYSPQKVDVLNLQTNQFETLEIKDLFAKCGNEYPGIEKLVSIFQHGDLKKPFGFNIDYNSEDLIVTFEGLLSDTSFVHQIHTVLNVLQNKLATPVDIEFAFDGDNFYLLQCRPQNYSKLDAPSPIPKNLPRDRIVFSANRFISNGTVNGITHIVYVIPEKYGEIEDQEELKAIGRAVGQLNKMLPRRQFILMGPGRWGSRGDIKLGVSVTYSDINNTAILVEIARKKGNYVPDLSFGTHFFQDLVEASIRYLPLYPDDPDIVFNEDLLLNAPNQLFELLPGYSYLGNIIHVIEIPQAANDMTLQVLMNGDQNKAVGLLVPRSGILFSDEDIVSHSEDTGKEHWRWRMYMAERIASQLEPERFNVKAMYVIGSTKSNSAQPGSDIDLLVHFEGDKKQKKDLQNWFEGWSLALDEMNFLRTGYKAGGILDVHYIDQEGLDQNKKEFTTYDLESGCCKELPLNFNNK